MSSENLTPARYATTRALRPALLLLVLAVGFGIYALGKVSWAVKAEHEIGRYTRSE